MDFGIDNKSIRILFLNFLPYCKSFVYFIWFDTYNYHHYWDLNTKYSIKYFKIGQDVHNVQCILTLPPSSPFSRQAEALVLDVHVPAFQFPPPTFSARPASCAGCNVVWLEPTRPTKYDKLQNNCAHSQNGVLVFAAGLWCPSFHSFLALTPDLPRRHRERTLQY